MLWPDRGQECITRGRWASSEPGSPPTRTAWTTWSGCAGRPGSAARPAGMTRAGGPSDRRFECTGCRARTSTTAGTIFDRTRTPLTVWFAACWAFARDKGGTSALGLQRSLEIGSYQTAWTMLHRLRSVLVRPDRERLAGVVEVEETYVGGLEPGLAGGRARGKKVLTVIAVETSTGRGPGRASMAPIPDGSAASLHAFITENIVPGSTVITDAWNGYQGLEGLGYRHDRRRQARRPSRRRGPERAAARGAPGRLAAGSAGCWAPTRAPWNRAICRPTSTSSSSGSTAAARTAAGWGSTESSSSPSPGSRCATST